MCHRMGCGRSRQMASPSSDNSQRQLNASAHRFPRGTQKENNGVDGKNHKKQKKNDSSSVKSDVTTKSATDQLAELDDNGATRRQNGEVLHLGGTEQNGVKLSFKTAFRDNPSQSNTFLAQAKVSTSQLDFFRMLDEKIAKGSDYASRSNSVISGSTLNDFHHI